MADRHHNITLVDFVAAEPGLLAEYVNSQRRAKCVSLTFSREIDEVEEIAVSLEHASQLAAQVLASLARHGDRNAGEALRVLMSD